jgi:hypothetical protein
MKKVQGTTDRLGKSGGLEATAASAVLGVDGWSFCCECWKTISDIIMLFGEWNGDSR